MLPRASTGTLYESILTGIRKGGEGEGGHFIASNWPEIKKAVAAADWVGEKPNYSLYRGFVRVRLLYIYNDNRGLVYIRKIVEQTLLFYLAA